MLPKQLTVGICVPSGPNWDADFGMCMLQLSVHLLTRGIKGTQIHFKFYNKRASLLPKVRQGLLEDAIQGGCDYALFIDSDQTFASNLLYMLLRHDKQIVACNVATKSVPASPTARNKSKHPGGDLVYTTPDKTGLEQVWRIGTGIMLIKLATVQAMPKPWFSVTYNSELGEFVGEDWYFCEQLEKAGVKIYIDHDASKDVGHRGMLTYHHGMVGEVVQVCEDAFLESDRDDPTKAICSKCKLTPAEHV